MRDGRRGSRNKLIDVTRESLWGSYLQHDEADAGENGKHAHGCKAGGSK